MATSPAARWERLRVTLAEAGVETKITERSYPGGVSRSITILLPGSGTVEVGDRWWRKNADVWIGWAVFGSTPEGIVIRDYPLTKKRGEVARNVVEALAVVKAGTCRLVGCYLPVEPGTDRCLPHRLQADDPDHYRVVEP